MHPSSWVQSSALMGGYQLRPFHHFRLRMHEERQSMKQRPPLKKIKIKSIDESEDTWKQGNCGAPTVLRLTASLKRTRSRREELLRLLPDGLLAILG
jgi:hypothetical protein